MSKSRSLAVILICSLLATPSLTRAQADTTKEQAESFNDIIRALLGPNWNLFLQGGFTRGDRFSLQQAVNTIDGQRALRSSVGYNVGVGGGVDVLLRTGFRLNYSFSSSNLNFRTDDGNGSSALNIDDVGRLMSHTVQLEVMRYMLPSRAAINPYGTLGIHATWWQLDDKSPLLTTNSTTPFSYGPLFSFGVQFRATEKWSGRVEAALSSGRNPFTGNSSFRALSGPTIDEPTSIGRSDYRFAGVYHFGRPNTQPVVKAPVARKKP